MRVLITILLCVTILATPVYADDLKGRATVYSDVGKTASCTDTRYGICATGNKELLGKYVILYQRLPDDSKGDCLGIFHVEDTGCKKEVIDIWCSKDMQNAIINKTYEQGCEGRIYIQTVEVSK